jgi:membrane associated rhomboid family serine protease
MKPFFAAVIYLAFTIFSIFICMWGILAAANNSAHAYAVIFGGAVLYFFGRDIRANLLKAPH